MSSDTPTQKWIKLPCGLYISAERMLGEDLRLFTLHRAANIGAETFNRKASKYDVHMSHDDPPIVRLVKYSMYLSRMGNDNSLIPTNQEYIDMAIEVASAAARDQEPIASFYFGTFLRKYSDSYASDVTRDILEFQERVKDKYIFTLFRIDKDGILEPVDDITTPDHDGHILELDAKHKYPMSVGGSSCADTRPMGVAQHSDADVRGYFAVAKKPEKGERRLVMHYPNKSSLGNYPMNIDIGENWLYSDSLNCVAALRITIAKPKKSVSHNNQS